MRQPAAAEATTCSMNMEISFWKTVIPTGRTTILTGLCVTSGCFPNMFRQKKLQIEFLNKWRNTNKYKGEVFAPENYSFEYLFATTLAGQPLAWMEGTNLPEEAFTLREHTEAYKKFQHDMHSGTILPIGDEPSGRSWTGFQSLKKDRGYLIVYRENHPEGTAEVETWLPEGVTVRCTPLMGHGKAMTAVTGKKGRLEISLPSINDYVVYKYEIKNKR